jgi:hypothetical protein
MVEYEEEAEKPIKLHYIFKFFDGTSTTVEIQLDPGTLNCLTPVDDPPDWARLTFNQCPNCPLKEAEHPCCPVAANISHLIYSFGDFSASETLNVMVLTKQRDYMKSTTVRDGLTSIMGVYMVTSGCPIMEKLKPLVRYHLPFASLEESVFRVVSMYLLIQHFLMKKGKKPDWELVQLEKIYDQIRQVNSGISKRLRNAAQKDAGLTALSNLDNLASLVPFVIDETLDKIENSLSSYLEDKI